MPLLKPDPTFYPSPKMAMQSPPEKLAYLALINPKKSSTPDAIAVEDVDPDSKSYGRQMPLLSWISILTQRGTVVRSGRPTCRTPVTSSITSDGMPAARACARTPHIRTWSDVF